MLARRNILIILVVVLAVIWVITIARSSSTATIHYRGETIKLTKSYNDYASYKNDPDNIDPSETERVQRLVMTAPIAHSFPSRLDLFKATGEIQFPGYGAGSEGGPQADGSELLAIVIEVPRLEKDRYIVVRGRDGKYDVVDDFVDRELPVAFGIREENGFFVYSARGHDVFRRAVTAGTGHSQ